MMEHRSPEEAIRARNPIDEHYEPGGDVPVITTPLPPIPVVSAASFAQMSTPSRSFLDNAGLLPHRNVTMLSGDGGTGKSLLALQLAAAVCIGGNWLGIPVRKGPVLHISAEDDIDENHIRLKEICAAEDLNLASMRDLQICSLAGEDAILATDGEKAGTIQLTSLFERLRSRLELTRPLLVTLDNLADVFAGNENSRPLARQFIATLRRLAIEFNCAVLLLAHPSLAGLNSGAGTSGSTAWNNSVRSRLYLLRRGDDDHDGRVLKTMKANYGPTGGEILLAWRAGRFTVSKTLEGSFLDAAAAQQKAERVFLQLLRWHVDKNINVSPNRSSSFAPTVFAKHQEAEGVSKDQFENAMHSLLNRNAIQVEQVGPRSRNRQRLVCA
jgi:RecA-family ATPase